jgi:carbonic anhydrase
MKWLNGYNKGENIMSILTISETKKTMIITGFHQGIYPMLPAITNKSEKDLMVLNSFGAVISQPYGCLMRNIILGLYNENVEEIYLIGETGSQEVKPNKDEMLRKIKEAGTSADIINAINYIDVVDHDVINWLIGPQNVEDVLKKNKDLIEGHPLIPKSIPVHVYIANSATGEYYPVSE